MNSKKILFVDDDLSMLNAYQRMLRLKPYQCEFESRPQVVLERTDLADISVLLVDHQMPGLSGATLLAALQDKYPTMKRVLLSGDILSAKSTLDSTVCLDAVLAKPCSKIALVNCLEQLLTDDSY